MKKTSIVLILISIILLSGCNINKDEQILNYFTDLGYQGISYNYNNPNYKGSVIEIKNDIPNSTKKGIEIYAQLKSDNIIYVDFRNSKVSDDFIRITSEDYGKQDNIQYQEYEKFKEDAKINDREFFMFLKDMFVKFRKNNSK